MKGFLNLTEASVYASISRPTLYKWLELGLKRHSIGGKRLINIRELDDFIRSGGNNYKRTRK